MQLSFYESHSITYAFQLHFTPYFFIREHVYTENFLLFTICRKKVGQLLSFRLILPIHLIINVNYLVLLGTLYTMSMHLVPLVNHNWTGHLLDPSVLLPSLYISRLA